MDKKKIYKRLKNGKGIDAFHRVSDEVHYTVRIRSEGDTITLHTYFFDGDDVTDESNYKDEKLRTFDNFDAFFHALEAEFPGILIEL